MELVGCTNCHELLEDGACIPATWNVDFALVDEREKKRNQEGSDELGALISNLRLGDDEMSIETYIHMEGKDITEL